MRGAPLAILTLLAASVAVAQAPPAPAPTSCVACHGNAEWFEGPDLELVSSFQTGVHADVGVSCDDCHGGNPDPALSDDMGAAMDESYAANPFHGAPSHGEVPDFCGHCHSDPEYMHRFRPDARVDQEREYWTSRHGELLRRGDDGVAVCIDCHGVHGILGPEDTESPVYPTHVATTCAHCHADAEHMAGRTLADGRPLPIDQYARWQQSVHAAAMFEREDLTAPTCNDCHGNHGAIPPGVDSIAFVCGQCHGREAELFRASPKLRGFEEHNQFLEAVGDEGCAGCHSPSEPAGQITTIRSLTECTTCHQNHAIVRPTLAMLAPLPELPCTFCHGETGPVTAAAAEPEAVQRHYEEVRDGLLAQADAEGVTDPVERFDWLVDQALSLPFHSRSGGDDEGSGRPALRPEFDRLFRKFRIGRTYFTYEDPATGETVRGNIVRCSDCHAAQPELADQPIGLHTSEQILTDMRQLTGLTARAERTMLAAQRGGVEVGPVQAQIDQSVDAQIQLEVLLHTFDVSDGSDFAQKSADGTQTAEGALAAAHGALHDLVTRRRGLLASLAVIALVLVGLGLKIRSLSRRGREGAAKGSGETKPA